MNISLKGRKILVVRKNLTPASKLTSQLKYKYLLELIKLPRGVNFSKNIGSDVPLFMLKKNFLLGKQRGNLVSKILGTNSLKLWHIIIVPPFKISTAYAYSLFDKYYLRAKRGLRNVNFKGKEILSLADMCGYRA